MTDGPATPGAPAARFPTRADRQPTGAGSGPLSRRRVLLGIGALGLVGAGTATGVLAGGRRRPTQSSTRAAASSPAVGGSAFEVLTHTDRAAPGDLFLTDMGSPPALVIAGSDAAVAWRAQAAKAYADLRLQSYRGAPVITWWESDVSEAAPYGDGRCVISDLDHNVIATVEPHGGLAPDEHEFLITPRDTALIVSYVKVPYDLSRRGGWAKASVMNGVVEEIDIASGKVLNHWESLGEIGLDESYAGVPHAADEPYDYFHINSVNPTPDGNYVVSARHTWGVYKISLETGKVLWRLGGTRSDFDVPSEGTFAWQHDAQFENPTTLRLFDNGSDGTVSPSRKSQVLWLALDETAGRATLTRRLVHPEPVRADAMGNAQRLANGNTLVGWGTARRVTEFAPDGAVVFDARLPNMSYRAYKHVWR